MIMTSADSVEYTSRYYWDGCIRKQNRRLISFSDYCLCCFDPQRQNSSTAQAIRFAKAKRNKNNQYILVIQHFNIIFFFNFPLFKSANSGYYNYAE